MDATGLYGSIRQGDHRECDMGIELTIAFNQDTHATCRNGTDETNVGGRLAMLLERVFFEWFLVQSTS